MLHILYFAVHYLFVFRHNLTPVFIKWKLFSFYLNMLYHDRSLNMKMIKNMIFKERFFNIFLFCHPSSLQGHVIISLVIYITTFDLFLILSFDFCRFWVVFVFFHPRHNGQWPPTSKDFLSQMLSITFIFLS